MEARDAARPNHGSAFKAFPGPRDPLGQPDSKVRSRGHRRHRASELCPLPVAV